jgi:FkbM family methyltransferase
MSRGEPTLKARVAAALSSEPFGRLLGLLLHDRIPNRGCVVDTRSPVVVPTIKASLFWGFYESPEIRFVHRYLRGDLDVVELGSSIGVVSAHIARRLSADRQLICVEPNPYLLDQIRINLALNAPHVRHRIVHGAIDYSPGRQGEVELEIGARNLGSRVASPVSGVTGAQALTRVPAVTLSGILSEHHIESYTLVADIEGAEAALLEHEETALARCRQLIIELHATTFGGHAVAPEALDDELRRRHGFKLRDFRATVGVYER